MTYIDWFVNNVGNATWWRAKACQKYPNNCHFEGGVDVPLAVGTPVYALAGGNLMGAGTFNMALGGFGHGVVTVQTPIGQVYYQHIDLDSSIPHCKNGNCGGYQVQTGQLLGYSTSLGGGEVEVGINPTWGGIWGTNSDPNLWVADPRVPLESLAQGFFASGTGAGTGGTGTPPQFATDPCSCINQPVQGVTVGCPSGQYKPAGSALCITCPCAGNTTSPIPSVPGAPSFASILDFLNALGAWILQPIRMLKLVFGVLGLSVALFVIFWPGSQVAETVSKAAKSANK